MLIDIILGMKLSNDLFSWTIVEVVSEEVGLIDIRNLSVWDLVVINVTVWVQALEVGISLLAWDWTVFILGIKFSIWIILRNWFFFGHLLIIFQTLWAVRPLESIFVVFICWQNLFGVFRNRLWSRKVFIHHIIRWLIWRHPKFITLLLFLFFLSPQSFLFSLQFFLKSDLLFLFSPGFFFKSSLFLLLLLKSFESLPLSFSFLFL